MFLIKHMIYSRECSMWNGEKCLFAADGWNVLYISVSFIWSIVLFMSTLSLLIFCLDDLFIVGNQILKSLLLLYWCHFPLQTSYYLLNLFRCSNIEWIYIYSCYMLVINWPLYCKIMTFFFSCYGFWFKVYFVWY